MFGRGGNSARPVMLTITTKYLHPTDTKGARIRASDATGRAVTIGYAHECDSTGAHAKALWAWLDKYEPRSTAHEWAAAGDSHVKHWLPLALLASEAVTRPTTGAR